MVKVTTAVIFKNESGCVWVGGWVGVWGGSLFISCLDLINRNTELSRWVFFKKGVQKTHDQQPVRTITWRTSFSRAAFQDLNCSDSCLIFRWRWTYVGQKRNMSERERENLNFSQKIWRQKHLLRFYALNILKTFCCFITLLFLP